ncbi:hypothetical protein F2Q69_00054118 [Brassica cretica]|uniref:Uncharacterized protein n=1 Tax=Brassica cretica TaxID=69181 RepID=A0A8S9MP97_BRACR|nr:hypothetical protein F2Q69_00054118 [Brassica cretica]
MSRQNQSYRDSFQLLPNNLYQATERYSSTVQVRYRFWEARNVPARPERMGVDMLLLDSQYLQRSTAEDSILDISREFEFVEQRSWVFCKYSSTQQHHELRCNLKTRLMVLN